MRGIIRRVREYNKETVTKNEKKRKKESREKVRPVRKFPSIILRKGLRSAICSD
jgi:CRISPR/Cas system CMR-associated protein Cmr5 small subunit